MSQCPFQRKFSLAKAGLAQYLVPGGGVALLRAVRCLNKLKLSGDEEIGKSIIEQAAYAPATVIG